MWGSDSRLWVGPEEGQTLRGGGPWRGGVAETRGLRRGGAEERGVGGDNYRGHRAPQLFLQASRIRDLGEEQVAE